MSDEVVEKQESKISKAVSEFGTFCYNSDEGTVLGRTGLSWVKITGFYILFYACLAGFFAICLHVMLMTIPDDRPRVIGRTNRPTISPTRKVFRSLFFSSKGDDTYKNEIVEFIKEYNAINSNITKAMTIGGDFEDCLATENNTANYESNKGCIFLWINRRIDWFPDNGVGVQCKWDKGIAGTGELNPGFSKKIIGPANATHYYPWTSKDVNGCQPVWAIQLEKTGTEKSEEAFLKCSIIDDDEVKIEDSAYYIFTVEY